MSPVTAKRKEERKSGLPPIQLRAAEGVVRGASGWFGGAGGGGFFGAGGLFGAEGGLSAGLTGLGGKVAVALLLCALGVGAFGVGRMLAPQDPDAGVAAQRLAFDASSKGSASSSSGLAGNDPGGSAMQVIPESLDGKTDAQRAAEEAAKAEAERRAREAAEAAAKAQTDKPAAEVVAPIITTPDAGTEKKNPFTAKFGELSKFGAGHAGLAGGAGMSGGLGGFNQKPLSVGEPRGLGKSEAARIASRAVSRPPSSRARGFAFRQLGRANGLSRAGAASTGESSSALADSAFSNAPISGQAITGGGAGSQAATGAGVQPGGPIAGTQNTTAGTQAPPAAQHKNSSQWQQIAMAGAGALMMGGMLLMYAAKTIQAGKAALKQAMAQLAAAQAAPGPQQPAAIAQAQAAIQAAQQQIQQGQMMAMLAAAMGAAAAGVGALLWKQFHQKQYGMIFIAGGALLAVLAMAVMASSGGDGGQGEAAAATNGATAAAGAPVAPGLTPGLGAAMASPAAPAGSALTGAVGMG